MGKNGSGQSQKEKTYDSKKAAIFALEQEFIASSQPPPIEISQDTVFQNELGTWEIRWPALFRSRKAQ